MTHSAYEEMKHRLRPGQLLDLLFSQVPEVCFFIKDREYRFVTGNPALVQILGASSIDNVVGKTDVEFTSEFLADAFREDDKIVMEQGQPILNKVELVPSPNTLEWRRTTKIPLYDHDGEIIGLAGMTREMKDSDVLYRDHPEMRTIIDYIQSHCQESLTKADMAAAAGISISTVERLFRKTFGITPGQYARKIRINAACQMIRDTDRSLAGIAETCGFFDQASMTHAFRSEFNITPNRYRQRYSNPSSEPCSAA